MLAPTVHSNLSKAYLLYNGKAQPPRAIPPTHTTLDRAKLYGPPGVELQLQLFRPPKTDRVARAARVYPACGLPQHLSKVRSPTRRQLIASAKQRKESVCMLASTPAALRYGAWCVLASDHSNRRRSSLVPSTEGDMS
jgi:hypothetical protein